MADGVRIERQMEKTLKSKVNENTKCHQGAWRAYKASKTFL